MIEYLILTIFILFSGGVLSAMGINSTWLVLFVILLTLPSVYAMYLGSPYLPTDKSTVKRMLKLAEIQPGEKVYDLGCGDGRLVHAAAKLGADSIGYELSIYLYLIARMSGSGKIYYKNYWKVDLSDADVIFFYQGPRMMARFEKEKWPDLKEGCRLVVNTFPFPNLEPTFTDGHVYRYDK